MTSPETGGNQPSFPPDETAPSLSPYWDMDPADPVHYTALTPDPEAVMDMKTWAKLHYQMDKLSLWEENPARGATPDLSIDVDFPVGGLYTSDGRAVTWLSTAINGALRNEDGTVEGWRNTTITLDLTRPGFVEVLDTYIALPEKMPATVAFEPENEPTVKRDGLYVASDASSVGFKQIGYVIGNEGAEQIIEIFRAASHVDDGELLNTRFKDALDKMDPSVNEACTRYYLERKALMQDPETAFKETTYDWGYMPTQFGGSNSIGLIEDHAARLVAIAIPGELPSDSEEAFKFRDEMPKGQNLWIKATWENDKLPDHYQPLFATPTKLESVTLAEVVKDLPKDTKQKVAEWMVGTTKGLKGWMASNVHSADSVRELDDESFEERKKASKEGRGHFVYELFESYTTLMKHTLFGRTYEFNLARIQEIEDAYLKTYTEYVELFSEFLEEIPMEPSLWASPEERDQFLTTLKYCDTELRKRGVELKEE